MISNGAPGRIRTCDLQIRSLLLYPAELRAHMAEREGFEPSKQLLTAYSLSRRAPSAYSAISPKIQFYGGGGGIRTHGTRKGSTVFKTASFNRSDTPPREGCINLVNANESISQAQSNVNMGWADCLLPFYYFQPTHIGP